MAAPDTDKSNFALFYGGDAYSTANKIMGRQSAGQSMMRGMVRTWPAGELCGVGAAGAAHAMLAQLDGEGYAGPLRWVVPPGWQALAPIGALYYPSPAPKDLAFSRNTVNPAAFSFMGVTFTLSSTGANDAVTDLLFPPFKPWDALICISDCARQFTVELHDEVRSWWTSQTGATRFNAPQLPVIPLGIDAPSFTPDERARAEARSALAMRDGETAFLFAGRLAFHGKAHPAPLYQALEQVARQAPVACIEAGVYPNATMRDAYLEAQQALAPSVRFVHIDGNDTDKYRQAWQGADVFVSLSDNIQETFGLTPVEAMAAGLPVVVSDWNGYKETVRNGVDGIRVATVLPPAGVGADIVMQHALGYDSYDMFIGRTSMATVVDPASLYQALLALATQPALRLQMGAAGRARAHAQFDWPVILPQYAQLADELALIRKAAGPQAAEPWPMRADPFARFAHFPTHTLGGAGKIVAQPDASARLAVLLDLRMTNFVFHPQDMPREMASQLLAVLERGGEQRVHDVLAACGCNTPAGIRVLMWLWKFDLVRMQP